jgi:hypothetical protein
MVRLYLPRIVQTFSGVVVLVLLLFRGDSLLNPAIDQSI